MIVSRRLSVGGRPNGAVVPGFTLVEVLLALVLGGMALSGAVFLLLGLSDRGRAIDAAAWRVNREANAERLLRIAVRNLRLSPDSMPSLEGGPASARFRSWCDGPAGLPVRCSIHLFIREAEGSDRAIVLRSRVGDGWIRGGDASVDAAAVELWSGLRFAGFLYLVDAARGGTWVDRWSQPAPPAALGVVVDRDTLVLPIH